MRGPYIETLLSIRFYPTANNAMAWKGKSVKLAFIDDSQFKIAAKRGCVARLPHLLHWRNQ